jgi:hypothetical protein
MTAAGAEPVSCKGLVFEWLEDVEYALATIRRVTEVHGPSPMRL